MCLPDNGLPRDVNAYKSYYGKNAPSHLRNVSTCSEVVDLGQLPDGSYGDLDRDMHRIKPKGDADMESDRQLDASGCPSGE